MGPSRPAASSSLNPLLAAPAAAVAQQQSLSAAAALGRQAPASASDPGRGPVRPVQSAQPFRPPGAASSALVPGSDFRPLHDVLSDIASGRYRPREIRDAVLFDAEFTGWEEDVGVNDPVQSWSGRNHLGDAAAAVTVLGGPATGSPGPKNRAAAARAAAAAAARKRVQAHRLAQVGAAMEASEGPLDLVLTFSVLPCRGASRWMDLATRRTTRRRRSRTLCQPRNTHTHLYLSITPAHFVLVFEAARGGPLQPPGFPRASS